MPYILVGCDAEERQFIEILFQSSVIGAEMF